MSEEFVEDIEKIRELTLQLAKTPIVKNKSTTLICHPFLISYMDAEVVGDKAIVTDVSIRKNHREWLRKKEKLFKQCNADIIFYNLLRDPFKFEWLEMCKPYLAPDQFTEYFEVAWSLVEYPSQSSVSIPTLISWFKEGKKELLMDEEELEVFSNLPDTITVYRGVPKGGNKLGMSWTLSKETAVWFKKRLECIAGEGCVYRTEVSKDAVLAYIDGREEKEVVLDVSAINGPIHVEPIEE